jgi:hypothetical protein
VLQVNVYALNAPANCISLELSAKQLGIIVEQQGLMRDYGYGSLFTTPSWQLQCQVQADLILVFS